MKKTLKNLFLASFILLFKVANAQYGIGSPIYKLKYNYNENDVIKMYDVYDEKGMAVEFRMISKDYDIRYISESGKNKKYTHNDEGEIYATCDKVIIKSDNANNLYYLFDNDKWAKEGDGKWFLDNKKYKRKCTAELLTENNEKYILIKGVFYGERNNQSR